MGENENYLFFGNYCSLRSQSCLKHSAKWVNEVEWVSKVKVIFWPWSKITQILKLNVWFWPVYSGERFRASGPSCYMIGKVLTGAVLSVTQVLLQYTVTYISLQEAVDLFSASRPVKSVFLGDTGHIFTTGFSRTGMREVAIWDQVSCYPFTSNDMKWILPVLNFEESII